MKRKLRRFYYLICQRTLYAFGKYPDLWDELIDDLVSLFADNDSNIQYCAFQLASTLKSPLFITPIISELRNDALNQNVSIFGARCKALEQITGIHIEPVPVYRDGQCWYSEDSNEARLYTARKWEEYSIRIIQFISEHIEKSN